MVIVLNAKHHYPFASTKLHCMTVRCTLVSTTRPRSYQDWIGLSSVLRPRQHSTGYMGDGFYRSEDPTNSIKVLKEQSDQAFSIQQ